MFNQYLNQIVIVDTSSSIIYLGTLESIYDDHLVLTDVDVHDSSEYSSTKEQYLAKTQITNIRPNRKKASVDRNKIISISLFSDIISL